METYYDKLDEIKLIVEKYFTVEDVFYDAGILTFIVSEREIKENFRRLYRDLRQHGFLPNARWRDGRVAIRIFRYQEPITPFLKSKRLPLYLFTATLGIVAVDGFLRSWRMGLVDRILEALLYTASIMLIIGLHEFGHIISAKKSGVEASPPYFIPGIPLYLPTFGAVIFQKEPIINRDDMFDMGFSGPLVSFLVSIAVTILAFHRAVWIPEAELAKMEVVTLPSPLLLGLMYSLFQRPGIVPLFTSVGFAAWLGFLVTALNLFPIWQLDGGKIFRSILTTRQYRIVSYVSLAILAIAGYFLFALLLLLMMSGARDIPPLDEVSPLSRRRKMAFAAVFSVLILSFTPWFAF
ncbi:MAG: site-2 protease family protein [Nitrososphaeria archaeon]|nr:site-2 protease family protein [Nitrososphaeria archaeon]